MPTFDRFDICEAYSVAAADYNIGGYTTGRRERYRGETDSDIAVRLSRMRFRAPMLDGRFENLSENGQEIYHRLADRLEST